MAASLPKKFTRASVRHAHCPGGQREPEARPYSLWAEYARSRCYCTDPEGTYPGGKCSITVASIKIVWDRDEAWKLKEPYLDRIDSEGDYRLGNIRFVEAYR